MIDDPDNLRMRSGGMVVVGGIMLVVAILLGLRGLTWALEDPCSGIKYCIPLVDFRPIGWLLVALALLIGLPGAWMAHSGSRPTDG
jgi:hypothetical protein